MNQQAQFALKRLNADLSELQKQPIGNVSALPLEDNFFEWHCNIRMPEGTCITITCSKVFRNQMGRGSFPYRVVFPTGLSCKVSTNNDTFYFNKIVLISQIAVC